MNSSILVISILLSTTWMLRVLDHQHYQSLTAHNLVAHTKHEYLLKGIKAYVRAYYTQHKEALVIPWQRSINYSVDKKSIQLKLISQKDGCIMVCLINGKKPYKLLVSL